MKTNCKLSRSEVSRRYRLANPEACKASQIKYRTSHKEAYLSRCLDYRKLNPEKELLKLAKHRAKSKGLPFNLEVQDILIPEFCPISGVKLESGVGKGRHRGDSIPSLDRFIPEKGYVKGNVWVISWRANHLKNNATLEELEQIVVAMKKVQDGK